MTEGQQKKKYLHYCYVICKQEKIEGAEQFQSSFHIDNTCTQCTWTYTHLNLLPNRPSSTFTSLPQESNDSCLCHSIQVLAPFMWGHLAASNVPCMDSRSDICRTIFCSQAIMFFLNQHQVLRHTQNICKLIRAKYSISHFSRQRG